MKHLTHVLAAFFWSLGGPGLLLLGILDSSFLFAPLGNDLLVVAMTARKHSVGAMLRRLCLSVLPLAVTLMGWASPVGAVGPQDLYYERTLMARAGASMRRTAKPKAHA